MRPQFPDLASANSRNPDLPPLLERPDDAERASSGAGCHLGSAVNGLCHCSSRRGGDT